MRICLRMYLLFKTCLVSHLADMAVDRMPSLCACVRYSRTFSEGSGNGGFFPHAKCGVSRVLRFALIIYFPAEKILQYYDFDISPILACDSSDLFSLTNFFLILQRLASLVRTFIYYILRPLALIRRLSLCSPIRLLTIKATRGRALRSRSLEIASSPRNPDF